MTRACGLLAALLTLAACGADVKRVPATRVIVRVMAEPAVLALTSAVRFRSATQHQDGWVERNDHTFEQSELTWPVEFVLSPATETLASAPFAVTLEALDGDHQPLVQERAVSMFTMREDRLLTITLAKCAPLALGTLCESNEDCLGTDCKTCVQDTCALSTPVKSADSLPAWTPLDTGDAGSALAGDAALNDAGPHVVAAVSDAASQEAGDSPDASMPSNETPDAASTEPVDSDATVGDASAADAGPVRSGIPDSGTPAGDASTPPVDLAQHCVDIINGYRAMLSVAALTRANAEESCVDGEAEADSISGTVYGAFSTCRESAENECPGWPSADKSKSIDDCLAQHWAEGPGDFNAGHGHYLNMTNSKYKSVACGLHDTGAGTFWLAAAFF